MEIKGYEGRYEIYPDGRIFTKGNRFNGYKVAEMKVKTGNLGYIQVTLSKDGKQWTHLVHRLVAEAFVPNPNGYPQVNHKDGVRSNNNANNLEWVSASQNRKHAVKCPNCPSSTAVYRNLDVHNQKIMYKRVVLEKDGTKYEFSSTREAAEFIGSRRDFVIRAYKLGQRCRGYKVIELERTANGEALIGKAKGNTVGKPETGTCIDYPPEGE